MPKVLVVDDDPDLATICSLVLAIDGYETGVARNGVEARDRLATDKMDLVLLDVIIPEVDGLTVCKMLKRDPQTHDLPVIMMSAYKEFCTEAHMICGDAVLDKPFDIDDLLNTVHRLIPSTA